jgi:hypothetical protein
VDGAALGRTCGLPWRRAACGGPAIKAVSAASRRLQMWMRVTVHVLYVCMCMRAACMVHTWMGGGGGGVSTCYFQKTGRVFHNLTYSVPPGDKNCEIETAVWIYVGNTSLLP